MRDATELESNGVNDYVNRISVETGVNFHNRRGERGMTPRDIIVIDSITNIINEVARWKAKNCSI